MTKWFTAGALLNQQPTLVSEVIEEAMLSETRQLRYMAGEDAHKLGTLATEINSISCSSVLEYHILLLFVQLAVPD
jgi:hypothetical protein